MAEVKLEKFPGLNKQLHPEISLGPINEEVLIPSNSEIIHSVDFQ